MRLQVNTSGAWRDVVSFDSKFRREVQTHAVPLAKALGVANEGRKYPSWRISEDGRTAVAYLEAPGYKWRAA